MVLGKMELTTLKMEYDRFIMMNGHLKTTWYNRGLSFSEFLTIKAVEDNKTQPPNY